MDQTRLRKVIAELEQELRDTAAYGNELLGNIEGLKRLAGRAPGATGTATPSVDGKGRPILKEAITIVMRELENPGLTLKELTDELWRRNWVGARKKDGMPSRETVRGTLLELQRQGVVRGEKHSDGPWAQNTWFLSNVLLTRPSTNSSNEVSRL
jgi:hypothetical protein